MPLADFRIMENIGKGSFASVYKVVRKSDNKVYAMKRVKINKMSKKEISDALNEIRFLASIRQKNIVGFLEAFLENNEQDLCIVMEFCGCGDLASKVERYKRRKAYIDEDVVWRYLIQCLKALQHLHEKGICHRDLKTANTFLTEDGSIKVGDMNVSKRLKKGQLQTQIGTPYYMSPEIWHNRPYDASSDMWSLGCMIYELCSLRPPFLGDSFPALKRAIAAGRYAPIPRKYSDGMQRVIRNMLQLDPRQRMTAEQLLRSPEIIPKLYLDGGVTPVSAVEAQSFPAMMDTIKVPQNLKHLGNALPKPCYPDVRPNSPGAWVVADRENATEDTSPRARVAVPPTGVVAGKENGIPAPILKSLAKDSCAPAVNGADRRLQALRDAGYKVPVQPSEPVYSQPPQMPPNPYHRPPAAAAGIPVASYMPQYDGVGGANGPYSRAKYRAPPNLIPAGQPRGW